MFPKIKLSFRFLCISIVECVSKPVAFLANRLQKALDSSAGLKPKTIVRIIVSRCEIDLADIKAEFERIAHRKLLKAIEVSYQIMVLHIFHSCIQCTYIIHFLVMI